MYKKSATHLDKLINVFDTWLRNFAHVKTTFHSDRGNPAQNIAEAELTEEERKRSAALMRVNHAGEVAAQALYKGQALVARQQDIAERMQHAAKEEEDHLVWCKQRLEELNSHTSYLDPVWFLGSFAIGVIAGLAGDRWSLGFIAETEKQVVAHLNNHLHVLPTTDQKSRVILEQMRADEAEHGDMAMQCGGRVLPLAVQKSMQIPATVMKTVAYYW